MVDPLSPMAGVWQRLLLAVLLCALVWGFVLWALE